MNDKLDQLTKGLAQFITRRGALKKLGVGLAGMAVAALGSASNAVAGKAKTCTTSADCSPCQICCSGICYAAVPGWCDPTASPAAVLKPGLRAV